jgi:acyl-[acyl-carrier-protein] desaturase
VTQALSIRDRVYRTYLDFLETAEKKRHWSVFDDIPWDALDGVKATEANAQCVEIFCAEELYLPDYSSKGIELVRARFGMAWFQACWAFEESKHGLVFREYLSRSGLRSKVEVDAMESSICTNTWRLPFETPRQMACYAALQEGATYVAYKVQKDKARAAGDTVLEAIYHLVGRDEAAHGGFYRAIIELELAQDRQPTIADLAEVLSNFNMPGAALIPNYHQRLRASGAGISSRLFVERVVQPLLTTLQISRHELKQALNKRALDVQVNPNAVPWSGN